MFLASVRRYPERPALLFRRQGRYETLTYGELAAQVRQLAAGLHALGLQAGDRVALLAENRPQWVIADLAALALGAVDVPLFTSLPTPQVAFIVADSGATFLIVSDRAQLAKALQVRQVCPDLTIVAMDGPGDPTRGVISWAQVMERGAAAPFSTTDYARRAEAVQSSDLASIVYTSGTTGDPKGVLLTHGNFLANLRSCQEVLHFAPDDVLLSVLPLNHVLERLAGYYLPLACGSAIAFAESLRRLRDNLQEVQPTYLILVPRLYQAFHEAILDQVTRLSPRRQRLFAWALEVGRRRLQISQAGRRLPVAMRLQWRLASTLVFRRLHRAMGFQRLKYFVSGGAALAPATEQFFAAVGLPILEGYGLTEASPVVSVNRPGRLRLGTVGPPLPGVELRLSPVGEVLVRGANVMQGYWRRPQETAEALDAEGWLHTGDLGELDEAGHLRLTDRLKDILVLSSGKNVASQPIENMLLASPCLAQIVLLGEGRPYVTALIVPSLPRLQAWAQQQSPPLSAEPSDLLACEPVRRLIRQELDRLSCGLADFERVRGFALLEREFTIESEELTPTMKVRRRVVAERYAELIRGMYR